MTFDANGNLLTQTDASGTTTYTWDARNRLVGISGPTVTATFSYDPPRPPDQQGDQRTNHELPLRRPGYGSGEWTK